MLNKHVLGWTLSLLMMSRCAYAAESGDNVSNADSHKSQETAKNVEPTQPQPIEQRAEQAGDLIKQRVQAEQQNSHAPFVIMAHRPNYILPAKYSPHPDRVNYLGDNDTNEPLDSVEVKFQLSLKIPLAYDLLGKNTSLWAGYTQQSFWQAYNSEISSPFRETNYEPELFMQFKQDDPENSHQLHFSLWRVGFDHQSNGRSRPASRSWNRIYGEFMFASKQDVISIKPWYRLPESSSNDDNPNIEKYYGYGELNWVHVHHNLSFDVMLRNNLRSQNKGAVQLGMSFPLWGKLRGYVQYFNGYGESLIDYNHSTESLGIGVMLTNWL